MIRQCAWCDVALGAVAPLDDGRITHGICEACAARLREQVAWMAAVRATVQRMEGH